MKAKVIKSFIDSKTKKPYNEGYIYETEDEERAKKLAAGGYIALPKAKPEPPKGENDEKPAGEDKPTEDGEKPEAGGAVSESDTTSAKGKKIPVKKEKDAAK